MIAAHFQLRDEPHGAQPVPKRQGASLFSLPMQALSSMRRG